MTVAPATTSIGSGIVGGRSLRTAARDVHQRCRLAKVVWLQHRAAFCGMLALYV